MWFLLGEVSSSSGCLGWAALLYFGTPWAFHIIIFKTFQCLVKSSFNALLAGTDLMVQHLMTCKVMTINFDPHLFELKLNML